MKNLKYILFIIACCFISELQAATFRPTNLTCERITNPLGIEVREPLLSWMIESSENGMRQSAYEIIVSDRKPEIDENKGNIWNTGKITSDWKIEGDTSVPSLCNSV